MYDFSMDKLSDLLTTAATDSRQIVQDLDISLVSPDPSQVRKQDNDGLLEDSLNDLANSIKAIGVTNPILVRENLEDPGKYIIICGERRYRASLLLGNKTIPALVKKISNTKELLQVQIIENLQRVDLNLEEVAQGIKQLTDSGLKGVDVAKLLGIAAPMVSYYLSVSKWPDFLMNYYHEGKVGSSPRTIYEIYLCYRKDAENTQWFLSDRIGKNGIFTRADAKDLKRFLEERQKSEQTIAESMVESKDDDEDIKKAEADHEIKEKAAAAVRPDVPYDVDIDVFNNAVKSENDELSDAGNDAQELNDESVNTIAEDEVDTDVDEIDNYQPEAEDDSKTVSVSAKENNLEDFDGYMEKDELSSYLSRLPLNVPLHVSVKSGEKGKIITISIESKD